MTTSQYLKEPQGCGTRDTRQAVARNPSPILGEERDRER